MSTPTNATHAAGSASTISRRDFVAGGATCAAIAGIGATATALADAPTVPSAADLPAGIVAADFAASPVEIEPVTEFAVEETYDIVVVGAGIAGVPAVLTAIDEGATVGCLQKEPTAAANGSGWSAYIAKHSTPAGLARCESQWIEANNWRCNKELFDFYFAHGEESLSWLIGQLIAVGIEPGTFNTKNAIVYPDGEVAASFAIKTSSNNEVMNALAAYAESLGAVFHYATPCVQLVKDESGRVTAAIGKREDGAYVKLNATCGVILCAGDYMNNDSLVERYCGDVAASNFDRRQVNRTGDGHLLGSLAGGRIVPGGHAKQIHDLAVTKYTMMDVPYLFLDAQGQRFFNEECTMTSWNLPLKYHCPGTKPLMFRFFDSLYKEKYPTFRNMAPQELLDNNAITEYDHGAKGIYRADTLEELCAIMGIKDPAPFVESIAHYNELCAAGADPEFGKQAAYLQPIDTPPFYGCRYSPGLAAINGGLTVDGNYQVVDENHAPIPGLYAAGVDAGDICGGVDWTMPGGCSDCHCMNAGRYTVIHALTGGNVPSKPSSFDSIASFYQDDQGHFAWDKPETCATAIELW